MPDAPRENINQSMFPKVKAFVGELGDRIGIEFTTDVGRIPDARLAVPIGRKGGRAWTFWIGTSWSRFRLRSWQGATEMHVASPNSTRVPPELVAILRVPASRLRDVVPVSLEPLDPFAEAEPSTGATIQLESGRHVVVIYGLETHQLQLHADPAVALEALDEFLEESGLDPTTVEWSRVELERSAESVERVAREKLFAAYKDLVAHLGEERAWEILELLRVADHDVFSLRLRDRDIPNAPSLPAEERKLGK